MEDLLRKVCSVLGVSTEGLVAGDEAAFEDFSQRLLAALDKLKTLADLPPVGEWRISSDDVPQPPYDIQSPVVAHLLSNWSSDANKCLYIKSWVECLATELPDGFPRGLQLAGCTPEIKDGFLLLLVPIMRGISLYPLEVHIRRRLPRAASLVEDAAEASVFDLRIKVILSEVPSHGANAPPVGAPAAASIFPLWARLGLGEVASSASSDAPSRSSDPGPAPSSASSSSSFEKITPLVASLLGRWAEMSPFRSPANASDSSSAVAAVAAGEVGTENEEEKESGGGAPCSTRSLSTDSASAPVTAPASPARTMSGDARARKGSEALLDLYGFDRGLLDSPQPMGDGTLPAPAPAPASAPASAPAPVPKKMDKVAERLKALREATEGNK